MVFLTRRWLVLSTVALFRIAAQPAGSFDQAQQFLKQYCQTCHQGTAPAGKFAIQQIAAASSIASAAERWNKVALRVRTGEMPPKGAPAPPADQREQFTSWVMATIRASACSTGAMPAPSRIRRLNRGEYASTVRDLL